jgi:hypothetical protein
MVAFKAFSCALLSVSWLKLGLNSGCEHELELELELELDVLWEELDAGDETGE